MWRKISEINVSFLVDKIWKNYLYGDWVIIYKVCGLYFFENKYHKTVENNKINPPENVVTREVFKPFHKICGAIFEISGTIFKALIIPTAVARIPKIAVAEPNNIILSMW